MVGSSAQRTNGDSTPYVDADGRPMTTVISPVRNRPQGRTTTPMDTDQRITAVEAESDPRDDEEIAISDDDDGYNNVTTNTPDSGDSPPDFARRGTLALKRAAAARARRDHVEQEQELHISPADLKRLLLSLGDHQELIQEQRELIRSVDQRLKTAEELNRHRRPDGSDHLPQGFRKIGRTPPRCEPPSDRRLKAAEKHNYHRRSDGSDHLPQGFRKRGRTPPRREPPSVATKRGRGTSIFDRLGEKLGLVHGGGRKGRTSPPYPRFGRRSRSPSLSPQENIGPDYEAYGSDEDDGYGPLSIEILNAPLPPGLERPPKLAKYDGQGDLDEHISVFNIQLDYLRVSGDIKCRLFSTTLTKKALDWYKALPRDSIHSWSQLSKQFRSRFTASRRPPKTIASLEAIVQGREETLRAYIERFSSEATQVTAEDSMKRYLLERGLRRPSELARSIGIEPPSSFNRLLERANAYIKYEEKEALANTHASLRAESSYHRNRGHSRGEDKRQDERPREKGRGPQGSFTNYTPLTASREHIFAATGPSVF
ncbi:hypothetical protein A2U01_0006354, partial [Trifolium medium]|nr:hypothetical protein [Trifolium medium]